MRSRLTTAHGGGGIGHAERDRHDFFAWYNHVHHHRGMGYFTPSQVYDGSHVAVQGKRAAALETAVARHAERVVRRAPRPPQLPAVVSINPATDEDEIGNAVNFPTLPKAHERLDGSRFTQLLVRKLLTRSAAIRCTQRRPVGYGPFSRPHAAAARPRTTAETWSACSRAARAESWYPSPRSWRSS